MSKSDKTSTDVIQRNKRILVKNIIPCQDFQTKLSHLNVFPNSMIKEIQGYISNEERNEKIIELLILKGHTAILKFIDALQLSGHNFLADFLRDELSNGSNGNDQPQHENDKQDLCKKLPRLERILPENDRDELIEYIRNKIKREIIAYSWKENNDKEKVLNAKQSQLEESIKFDAALKLKDNEIEELKKSTVDAAKETHTRALEVNHLKNYIEELNKKHKKEMETQMQFNLANDSSLQRVAEKDDETNNKLEVMLKQMEECLHQGGYSYRPSSLKTPDKNRIPLTVLDKARAVLVRIFDMTGNLISMKEKYNKLLEERKVIQTHLGIFAQDNGSDHQDLDVLDSFRQYIISNEERSQKLKEDMLELEKAVRAKSAAVHQAISNIEHNSSDKGVIDALKSDIALKENMLTRLSDENSKLRTLVSQYKAVQQVVTPRDASRTGNTTKTDVSRRKGTPFARQLSATSGDSFQSDDGGDMMVGNAITTAGLIIQPGGKGVQFIGSKQQSHILSKAKTEKESNYFGKHSHPQISQSYVKSKQTSNGYPMQANSTALPPLSKQQQYGAPKIAKVKTNHHSMPVMATQISNYATPMTMAEANFIRSSKHNETDTKKRPGKVFQIHSMTTGTKQVKPLGGYNRSKPLTTFNMRNLTFLQ